MESAPTFASARNMPFAQRKDIALHSMRQDKTVTGIAKDNHTSRQFVYRQQLKAVDGINQAFAPAQQDDNKVLFLLPVTKMWLHQLILALVLHCKGSFRGVTQLLADVFDYQLIASFSCSDDRGLRC